MLQTRWALWIGFWGLAIGTLLFGAKAYANRRERSIELHLESFFICLWAAIMYMTMTQGLTVSYINGKEVCWGRYVDWAVTTPLLLLQVGTVAGASWKLITKMTVVDLFMIITGWMASISPSDHWSFIWFIVSCSAGFVIIWDLVFTYGKLAPIEPYSDVRDLSSTMRYSMIITWLMYPFAWIISHLADPNPETCSNMFYTMLDLYAKLAFGLILNFYTDRRVLAEAIMRQRNRG